MRFFVVWMRNRRLPNGRGIQRARVTTRFAWRGRHGVRQFHPGAGVSLRAFAEEAAPAPGARKVRWGILLDFDEVHRRIATPASPPATPSSIWSATAARRTDPQWIRKVTIKDELSGHVTSLPVMCQHCAEPPCVDVCPTGASFQRPDGIVLIDRHICIGCRYCIMACPYTARNFVNELVDNQRPWGPRGKGTAEACTMCVHRVDEGRTPACVEACSTTGNKAMMFGDLNDPEATSPNGSRRFPQPIRADLRTDPGVRYEGI